MTRFTFILRMLAFAIVIAAIIFVAAGRWDLPFVWGILAELMIFNLLLAAFGDEGLLRERQAPGSANQDRLTRPLGIVFMLSHWVLVGLDVGRWHWSLIPWQLQVAGLIGYGGALCINFWAVMCNPFYSSVVRVQSDRGQQVIAAGPYRIVRHPGYAATLFAMFAGGIALGSWIAMLPVFGFAALFVRRTLLEDRMLLADLPGYAEYAQTVRYRLVAGIF